MTLKIQRLVLGPLENNLYLLGEESSRQAVAIDPGFDAEAVLEQAERQNWTLTAIWLTHAHFDHIAGVKTLREAFTPALPVLMHPADLPLFRQAGGATRFGLQLDPGPEPEILLSDGQTLALGEESLEVRHVPGHTPGHVLFYSASAAIALVGDLIFYRSVGRTDLPGASAPALVQSIRSRVYTLPPATRLLPGHGQETTVQEEIDENPYV